MNSLCNWFLFWSFWDSSFFETLIFISQNLYFSVVSKGKQSIFPGRLSNTANFCFINSFNRISNKGDFITYFVTVAFFFETHCICMFYHAVVIIVLLYHTKKTPAGLLNCELMFRLMMSCEFDILPATKTW